MTSTLEPFSTLGVSGTMSTLGNSGSLATIEPSKKHARKQVISLQLIDLDKFLVSGQISAFTQQTKDLLKRFSAEWDQDKKGWKCNLTFYKEVSNQLKSLGIEVKGIPAMALDSITPMQDVLSIQKDEDNPAIEINYSQQEKNRRIERELPSKLLKNLYEFQKQGIQFGLRNYGRVLFADEMGVGKTIQAICLATCFRNAWPLIVICPSSLKYIWKEEILKWDGTLKENQIQIMMKHVSEIYLTSKVLICSYDIVPSIIDKIKRFNFNIAIADEAHYLKNLKAKRTLILVPYLKRLRHVILLTGTPAFARPMEMFTLLQIVRPDVFKQLKPFGDRYCDPRPSKFGSGQDYQGSSNEKELHFILKKTLMIRRLKSEVLSQLPRKRRKKVLVNIDPKILREIQDILNHTSKSSLESLFDFATKQINGKDQIDNDLMRKSGSGSYFAALSLCYQLSGLAKMEELKNYIKYLLENQVKLIIFAHHLEMLNKLEMFVSVDLKVKSIRIDGQVSAKERYDRVQQFQTDESVRVAVLSLSAASTGLTLTASSDIVFAEMHWTPALMLQAEDRAHRIGQENSVLCHYIVGQQTLDDILYKKIEQKIAIVSNILDGQTRNLKMDLIRDAQGLEILENEENTADEEEQNNEEFESQLEKDRTITQQNGIVLEDQNKNDTKQEIPFVVESGIKQNLSEDSDEDDNDLMEMMSLKRIAEQEALKRKLQPQQTQLDWKNTEKNDENKKKQENNVTNNPVKPSIKTLDEIFLGLKSMASSVGSTQLRQDSLLASQKIPILQNQPIQRNASQLEEQAKIPAITGNLSQRPSKVCVPSSMEIENQPPQYKARDYVKEIEKAQEKCNNSKKTSCQSRLTTGFDFLDEALDERSDGEETKTEPDEGITLNKNHGNEIVIAEDDNDDNDIDLNAEEETYNNSKQLMSANFVRERKVLKNGKIVEKQENGIYKITHRNGDSYFISDYEESKEEAEDENDHAHPIQLNDFFNEKKFIPTKFSNYSSGGSKLNASGNRQSFQSQSAGGIRFRKSFIEDNNGVHHINQDDQTNKKLKKSSYFQ